MISLSRHSLLLPLGCVLASLWSAPLIPRADRFAPSQSSASALEIRFLDVGQGDAILLRSGGRVALIDAGQSDRIVGTLRALNVDTIELFIATHNHADHVGGADAVLDSFPVRFYLDNGLPAATQTHDRVLERLSNNGRITYLSATSRTISVGETKVRILPAPIVSGGDDQNNRSVAILIEHGRFRALASGDSEVEQLNALMARDSLPDVDLLKAAHHGSRNGVTPAWLSRLRPEVVVISAGAGNSYGHPHPAAMRYYCAGNRRVYRTDRNGDISIRVDSTGVYQVYMQRVDQRRCTE